jgi:amidophosphoribosyltransferase
MCGIIGITSNENKNISHKLIDALTILQHRGQDSSGICTLDAGHFHIRKGIGAVEKVFKHVNPATIPGNQGLGHVRYSTSGSLDPNEAQPLYLSAPYGISLVHNGNLTNTEELRESLLKNKRHINSSSDSEILLNIFAEELQQIDATSAAEGIFHCVQNVMQKCKGGFSVIISINGVGMVAFRDPYGIRPLCFGFQKNGPLCDYAFASESIAFDMLRENYKLSRDVYNGEYIFIDNEFNFHSRVVFNEHAYLSTCLFEYIYFARPDSIIDGLPVYIARKIIGKTLAAKILKEFPNNDIDVVMPIPETSRIAALEISRTLNKPYEEGFIKNRYIPRTFIMPEQKMREKNVQLKLNTIKEVFRGKNVLIVDDSIVRGTTSKELIKLAKDAGAQKVYLGSTAPPIVSPNVYGIDIPTRKELVAYNRTADEIAQFLGAEFIIYNDLSEIIKDLLNFNKDLAIEGFESSCFNGNYISGNITESYLQKLEETRVTK